MRYISLYLLLFVFSIAKVQADELFQGSSSVPAKGLPWSVELPTHLKSTSNQLIKVKVFPHDLKNDWVHGKRDNAARLEAAGKFILDGKETSSLKIVAQNGKLSVKIDGATAVIREKLSLTALEPIKLIRERNPDKTHSYEGRIDIISLKGEILAVNTLNIEKYLRGVVPKEAVYTWPSEALKTQAVAARTYAIYHLTTSRRKLYDVDDTARYQVYAGVGEAKDSTDKAVLETKGEVLVHKGKVIVAFFHAYSGGRTDSAENIFGNPADYCLGAKELFTRAELKAELRPSSQWIVEWTTDPMSKSELLKKVQSSSRTLSRFDLSRDFDIFEKELNPLFKSVKTLEFEQTGLTAQVDFKEIRKQIGWSNFPSYHYRMVQKENSKIVFKGHGWGHHVGMSQWGAFIMAKNLGMTYEEILDHYYAQTTLEKL